MPRKDQKRPVRSKHNAVTLRLLYSEIEKSSYFDLPKEKRKLLESLEQTLGCPIEAWTFVPHPAVIAQLQPTGAELTRHIITIDTLRSRIYFKIKDFLQAQAKNVNSYYSGGWADFICDGYFTKEGLREFLESLEHALNEAGAASLAPENDVSNLITLFRVDETLVLCGRPLASVGTPSYEVLQQIAAERVKFEVVYRNYRSPEALQQFGGNERELRRYLKWLKEERALLCYELIFDYARFVDTEYVPLCQATKVMDAVLRSAQGNADLKGPIVDLLRVRPERVTDEAENEVTHIFINEYTLPGDRQRWKSLLYRAGGDEINLYTYPLEGTLNESPVHLSDLPEVLSRARAYAPTTSSSILLGRVLHPLEGNNPPEVYLAPDSLSQHGVTLGAPGTGKTNTDMVILSGIARVVQTSLVIDATKGVAGKLAAAQEEIGTVERFEVGAFTDQKNVDAVLSQCISAPGLFLIEPDSAVLPRILDSIIEQIESLPDRTTGNRAREINGFLLIEEANDAWGANEPERQRRLRAMEGLLNKAWRKGWCIWLSTQSPSHLGYDAHSMSRMLGLLGNRVIHNLGNDRGGISSILFSFRNEGMSASDVAYAEGSLENIGQGVALVRGTTRESGKVAALRPVLTKIRMLGAKHPPKPDQLA